MDVWRTGPHEASVVPLHLAKQGFRDGQWQLADLTYEGALRRQKATVPAASGRGAIVHGCVATVSTIVMSSYC